MINNEKGVALILVLITLVVLSTLVAVMIDIGVFNINFIGEELSRTQAFFIAESGVQRAIHLFHQNGKSIYEEDYSSLNAEEIDFLNSNPIQLTSDSGEVKGSYYITKDSITANNNLISLEITGEYNNKKEKIGIEIELENVQSAFNSALFAGSEDRSIIDLSGGATINGDLITNSAYYNAFKLSGGTELNGDIFLNNEELADPPEDTWNKDTVYNNGETVWYNGMKYIQNHYTKGDRPDLNSMGLYDKWRRVVPKFNQGDNLEYTKELNYRAAEFPAFSEPAADSDSINTSKQSNITGRIVDSSGNGLSGVKIYRSFKNNPATSQNYGTIGDWTLYAVKGTVTITPVKDGYVFSPASVRVSHPSEEIIFEAIPTPGKNYDNIQVESGPPYYEIGVNDEYNEINVTGGVPLKINMNNGNRKIIVNKLNVSQGDIELINKGDNSRLDLYIDETFNFGGSSELNSDGNIKEIMIYYNGENDVSIGGGTALNSNIFVNKSNLTFTAGSSINGHIISNGDQITISGGSNVDSRVIYAPNSKVSLGGGGKVKGSVIADRFEADGGTVLEYDSSPFVDEVFFDILNIEDPAANNSTNQADITWYNK